MMESTTDTDVKSLVLDLLVCCMRFYICSIMDVMAVDDILSNKGTLICAQHDASKSRLCRTALEIPLTKVRPLEIAH
jgi:hypothetical protein